MANNNSAPVTLRQLATPLVIVSIAAALCVLVAIQWAAQRADAQALSAQQALVAKNIERQKIRLLERVNSELMWDEAVAKLANDFDVVWADANIADWFLESHEIARVMIIDGENQPLYYAENGVRETLTKASALGLQTASLIQQLRQKELERGPVVAPLTLDGTVSKPINVAEIMRLSFGPAIVVATLVQPDFGKSIPNQPTAPIVFSIKAIDNGVIREVADVLSLQEMRAEGSFALERGRASVALKNAHGENVTWISWRPDRPGSTLLISVAPFLALAYLAFVVLVGVMLKRTWRTGALLQASEAQAREQARMDALTGLPNRLFLNEQLNAAGAIDQAKTTLMLLDLDRFKDINDAFGHQVGDALLVEIATRLKPLMPNGALLARLGGDEFAIVLPTIDLDDIAILSKQILVSIAHAVSLNARDHHISASIGVALSERGISSDELMRRADVALNHAKASGRARAEFHNPVMDEATALRRELAQDLRSAVAQSALQLHYQPQYRCTDNALVGVEALIRWDHPTRGWIEPSLLIAIAEESGVIHSLGNWVLNRVLLDGERWPKLRLALNVSPQQFKAEDFAELLQRRILQSNVAASRIELEITETLLLDPSPVTSRSLVALRAYGFKLVLDDFGTGYSSLGYLRRYRLDKLKIDRSFVQCADEDAEGKALLSAIAAIARSLKLELTAEGVETSAQQQLVKALGCDSLQGYLFSKALPRQQIDELYQVQFSQNVYSLSNKEVPGALATFATK